MTFYTAFVPQTLWCKAFALIETAVCHTWVLQWSVTFQFYHEAKWQEFSRFAVVCLQWSYFPGLFSFSLSLC